MIKYSPRELYTMECHISILADVGGILYLRICVFFILYFWMYYVVVINIHNKLSDIIYFIIYLLGLLWRFL